MSLRTSSTWLRRHAVVPVAFLTVLGLAVATSPSSAASANIATLCQVTSRVDGLVVTRHAPHSQFRFTFPAVVTVHGAASAQAVARAACALPTMKKGLYCPAEFAVSYKLTFAVRGEKGSGGESIVVNPTGCELVTGLGTVRTTAEHPRFYRVLGNAMGLKDATVATFAGALKS